MVSMIVAVVDDLMFTSRIRSAATAAGVTVTFARTREAAVSAVRAHRPSLVVLDLNNPRTDPLGIVTALKADDELREVATVGYVSHVASDVIDAARAAGVDRVLARSAFTERLVEILQAR